MPNHAAATTEPPISSPPTSTGRADHASRAAAEQPSARASGDRSVIASLQEYGRGIAGGILFSLPLLYTMEMWWGGFSIDAWSLAAAVVATFALLLGYNRYAGLRNDASMAEVAIDSVEELGIGLVTSTVILWLLGQIAPDMPLSEVVGKIVIEALTVAVGVSVGTAQLGSDDGGESGMSGDSAPALQSPQAPTGLLGQIVLACCGAVLIAANVAPTEEIIMLAVSLSPLRLIGLVLAALALSALILYFSDFRGARAIAPADGFFGILYGSVITYMVALLSAAALLWFFGSFDGFAFGTCLAETIILSVPGVLGASAGRLLLQSNSQ